MGNQKALKVTIAILFIVLFVSLAIYIPYEYFYNSRIFNLDLSIGDKYLLNILDEDVTYETSDDSIALVDDKGRISIINFGTVKVTVKDKNNKMKYRYDITVEDSDNAALALDTTQLELKTGDTYQIIHTYISKETPKSIKWESSNPSVVTVDNNGIVKGISEGTSTIKLTIDTKTEECVVNVSTVNNSVEPNYIVDATPVDTTTPSTNIGTTNPSTNAGTTKPSTNTGTTKPSTNAGTTTPSTNTGTTKPSTNAGTTTPSTNTGTTAKPKTETKPQAIITTNKQEDKPKEVVVESISSDITSKSIYVGETYQTITNIIPINAKTTLTYKSANTKIATVTNKGVVKGIAKGTTNITVTSSNGKTYSITIEVKEVVKPKKNQTFTATLVANGAALSKTSISCTTSKTNCKVTLPNFTRDGYNILGYSTNPNAISAEYKAGASIALYANTTYYAITSKTVTATFLPLEYVTSNKVSCTMYNTNTSCNVTTPSITRANYASLGFNTDSYAASGSVGVNSTLTISSDVTYYAITKINQDGILAGCTGWAAGNISYYSTPSGSSEGTLTSGQVFTIEELSGQYFKVSIPGKSGYKYVKHDYVMINLPDYIPSIVYDITNAYSAIYKSSGKNIPGITGARLYSAGKIYNIRLRRNEFMAPMIYSTAKKLLAAQSKFKNEGYRIKAYDTYRPASVSNKVASGLQKLYDSDAEVKKNIDKSASGVSWGKSYFIAGSGSKHNFGVAIDATLVNSSGQELTMPTAMHELSAKAVKYAKPGDYGTYAKEMNDNAKYFDRIMKSQGFSTISGEWWHFQEPGSDEHVKRLSICDFQVTSVYSY